MANNVEDAGTALIEDFFPEDPASNPAEPKSAPVSEKSAEKPKHPAYLVKAAKSLQFTDAEIAEYSPAELKEAIQFVNMTRTQDRKEQQVMQEVQRDAQTGRFVKQESAPEPEPEFSLKELGVNPEEWSEDTVKFQTSVLKPIMKEIKELKALKADLEEKINGLAEREQTRERESELDKLDQLFVKDEAIFGKGSRFEMAKGSPEIRRRKAMIGAMSELFQTEKGISHKECYERAKEELFGGFQKHEEKAEEVQEEVKTPARPRVDMTNGHTVQPTAKAHAPQPKGHKLAVQNLANRLKVPAINNGEPSEFDELPD